MKHAAGLFMATLTLCLFSACTKETTLSGTITDLATGQPLEGVKVSFTAIKFYKRGENVSDRRVLETKSDVTGPDGRYYFQLDTKQPDRIEFEAEKDGYNYEYKWATWGESESADFAMNPIDATLRIKVVNESGIRDNMYAVINAGSDIPLDYFQPWPFLLNAGDSLIQTFQINGGQMLEIRWGNDENEPLYLYEGVHRDSVYCPRGVITDFLLKI